MSRGHPRSSDHVVRIGGALGGNALLGRRGRWMSLILLGVVVALAARSARRRLEWPGPPRWTASPGTTTFDAFRGSPAAETRLRVLATNRDAWLARWTLVAGARRSIDVACFIIGQDAFGMAFLGHLLRRAEEGVRVRVLLDAQGREMSALPRGVDCLPALAAVPGADVRVYRPLARRVLMGLATLSPTVGLASSHDKAITADGRWSIVGGRNVEARYFADPEDLPAAFADLDVLATGRETAAALTAAFDTLYAAPVTRALDGDAAPACRAELLGAYEAMDAWLGGEPGPASAELRRFPQLRGALLRATSTPAVVADARVIDSVPRLARTDDAIGSALRGMIAGASREILLVTPYLVLPEEFVEPLAAAGRRGVRITVLTNSPVSSDNPLSQRLFREQWPRLAARVPGLRLFASGRRTVHEKLAVADGALVLLGSFNLDPLSLSMNGEIALAVRSRAFARAATRHTRRFLAAGAPHVYRYRIVRDAAGYPRLDGAGRPVVRFGPRDHSDPARWPQPDITWRLLGVAVHLPVVPRLL